MTRKPEEIVLKMKSQKTDIANEPCSKRKIYYVERVYCKRNLWKLASVTVTIDIVCSKISEEHWHTMYK